jgi:ribosomal protein S18 acetylase RimI-like enzyme
MVRTIVAEDLSEIGAIHRAAFPASWLTALGAEAVRRYYAWQLGGPHDAYPIGAVLDGQLAGFCFGGVFPTAISGFVRRNMWFLTLRLIARPRLGFAALFQRRVRAAAAAIALTPKARPLVRSPVKRPFDILSVAVHPRFQGRGIGKLLMDEARAVALRNGFSVMTLMVNPENAEAVRFYERIGWQRALMKGIWRGNMEYWLLGQATEL